MRCIALFIAVAVALSVAIAGCAPMQQSATIEQDADAIVAETEEAAEEIAAIDDTGQVKADMEEAERMVGDGEIVVISGFEFQPRSMVIRAGSPVEFVNKDDAPHTATGDTWDTGTLAKGQSRTMTFDTPGVYDYVCRFHPGMRGQIIVE